MRALHRGTSIACALALTGCGAWFEASFGSRAQSHASATVAINASVQTSGGLVIVEQPSGQGFVLDGEVHGTPGIVVAQPGTTIATTVAGGAEGGVLVGAPSTTTGANAATVGIGGSNGGAIAGSGANGASAVGGTDASATANGGAIAVGGSSATANGGTIAVGGSDASATANGGAIAVGGSSGGAGSIGTTDSAFGANAALDVEAAASVPRSGVHGLDGRGTTITALLNMGVQVDGVRVRLADLEALAALDLPSSPSAQLSTDGSIEAWAELEHDQLPRAGGETHVVVRVRGNPALHAPRARLRVHLVIDRSSSMQSTWAQVIAAARMLIARLAPEDELQIVAYGSDATVAFATARVGDGRAARSALDEITVGGGTNIEAGLRAAYGAAEARSLVILLSDGVPTQGAFEPAEIGAIAARARVNAGCTTSVIGLGTEFDARLLRSIAGEGRGAYHVSTSLDGLAAGLVAELDAHARVAARAIQVHVALPAGVQLLGVQDGNAGAQQIDGSVLLTMPSLAVGEERRLVLDVRVPAGQRATLVAGVTLDYRAGIGNAAIHAQKDLSISYGGRAVLAQDGQAGASVINASLSAALDLAGQAIANNDAAAAARALDAHATEVEGRIEMQQSPILAARVRVVRRLADAVAALGPGSTYPQRAAVSLAFGGLAVRIGR